MLVRDGCQEKTSKTSNTLSRIMILGILLLQPSNTFRSLSLLKHSLNHLDPQSSTCVSAQDCAPRSPRSAAPSKFLISHSTSGSSTFLLTPDLPKPFPPKDTVNWLRPMQ